MNVSRYTIQSDANGQRFLLRWSDDAITGACLINEYDARLLASGAVRPDHMTFATDDLDRANAKTAWWGDPVATFDAPEFR